MHSGELDLRELVSHPNVVELLDALSRGPMTLAEMRSHVATSPRRLADALRIVAAHGLVARSDNGSWDDNAPVDTTYLHTAQGREVVERLANLAVWTTLFDPSNAMMSRTEPPNASSRDRDWS